MEIVPVENDKAWKDDTVTVDGVKVEYIQSSDCVSHEDATQTLEIFTENNGTARFMILKTKRWAIGEIDDIVKVLQDFKSRAGIFDEKEKEE